MILRDARADVLQAKMNAAQTQIVSAQKADSAAPVTSQALADASVAIGAYRAVTKNGSLHRAGHGVLVNLAGVHALSSVWWPAR